MKITKNLRAEIERIWDCGLDWWDTGNREPWSDRDEINPSATDVIAFAERMDSRMERKYAAFETDYEAAVSLFRATAALQCEIADVSRVR